MCLIMAGWPGLFLKSIPSTIFSFMSLLLSALTFKYNEVYERQLPLAGGAVAGRRCIDGVAAVSLAASIQLTVNQSCDDRQGLIYFVVAFLIAVCAVREDTSINQFLTITSNNRSSAAPT